MDNPTLIHNLLHHLSAVFTRESDQILQEQLGITFSQFKIMTILSGNPAAQQRQLAVNLGQTEASVSRQIKLLLRKGMLTSRPNPRNRRAHLTTLTPKGERITLAAQNVLANFEHGSLEGMNAKQQQQLVELLLSLRH